MHKLTMLSQSWWAMIPLQYSTTFTSEQVHSRHCPTADVVLFASFGAAWLSLHCHLEWLPKEWLPTPTAALASSMVLSVYVQCKEVHKAGQAVTTMTPVDNHLNVVMTYEK